MNFLCFLKRKKPNEILDYYELNKKEQAMLINKYVKNINKKIEDKAIKEKNITASFYMKHDLATLGRVQMDRKGIIEIQAVTQMDNGKLNLKFV
jgi:hypothetical protein